MIYNEELYEINLYPDLAGYADAPGPVSASIGGAFWRGGDRCPKPRSQNAPNEITNASENIFVGSIKSDKYHYPSCRAAQKIKPEDEIWFTSSADARAHGYVPCGICNPP